MNAALASILARYPASARPTSEPIPLGNAGGLSGARLWRVETARGPLAARLWPDQAVDRPLIERIHRWLSRADDLGFVPIPIPARDGRTVQEQHGRFWDLSPWKPGIADRSVPPHRDHVAAAFSALAEFHLAMHEVTPLATSPGLASRLAEIESLVSRDLAAWRGIVSQSPADPEIKSLATRWLDLAAPLAPRLLPEIRAAASRPVAIQPVIRDTRPEHFLFTQGRVTGLVDFGAMGIDTVSTDLGRLIGEWIGEDDGLRGHALAAYSVVRPLSPDEFALIAKFKRTGALLSGSRWLRWHFVEAVSFGDHNAVREGLRRSVARCERIAIPRGEPSISDG